MFHIFPHPLNETLKIGQNNIIRVAHDQLRFFSHHYFTKLENTHDFHMKTLFVFHFFSVFIFFSNIIHT